MIQKMSDMEYFKTKGISQSFLKAFRRSPAHARHILNNPDRDTLAMRFGSCLHALVLEHEKIYMALPDSATGNNQAAKMIRTQYALDNPKKILLSASDADKVEKMAQSIWQHIGARSILELSGSSELPIFWDENGVRMKAKLDRINQLGIIDVKTTKNASKAAFSKSICEYGYHVQAAHYRAGAIANDLPADEFIFIAVENEAPYCAAVMQLNHVSIMEGEQERQELIQKYLKCVEKNHWPGYNDEIETVSIPRWGFKHIINEEF